MTKQEYLDFHAEFCAKMTETTVKKNNDYAGDTDPFRNFKQIAGLVQLYGIDVVAIGFLTRMSDKFSRIGTFITKGELQVKEESVFDALLDLSNYSVLLAGYLRDLSVSKGQSKTNSL
jgi:hypothetical protein